MKTLNNFINTPEYEELKKIFLEEKTKIRDVLNIEGKTREEISIEVKGKQFAVDLIDKFLRRVGLASQELKRNNKSYK